jgi:nucleotide-binding universal stress UspA family protein
MFDRILVAVDNSLPAKQATDKGVQLARRLGAEILLLHVIDLPEDYTDAPSGLMRQALLQAKHKGRQLLSFFRARIPSTLPCRSLLRVGKSAEMILATAAEQQADMIVLGTHGRSGMSRLLLGSTAEAVLRQATCPVLTIRPEADETGLYEPAVANL